MCWLLLEIADMCLGTRCVLSLEIVHLLRKKYLCQKLLNGAVLSSLHYRWKPHLATKMPSIATCYIQRLMPLRRWMHIHNFNGYNFYHYRQKDFRITFCHNRQKVHQHILWKKNTKLRRTLYATRFKIDCFCHMTRFFSRKPWSKHKNNSFYNLFFALLQFMQKKWLKIAPYTT